MNHTAADAPFALSVGRSRGVFTRSHPQEALYWSQASKDLQNLLQCLSLKQSGTDRRRSKLAEAGR